MNTYNSNWSVQANFTGFMNACYSEDLLKMRQHLEVANVTCGNGYGELLKNLCRSGRAKSAQLLATYIPKEQLLYDCLFIGCIKGRLLVVQSLWDIVDIMLQMKDMFVRESCRNGHLHIVKWLHTQFKFDDQLLISMYHQCVSSYSVLSEEQVAKTLYWLMYEYCHVDFLRKRLLLILELMVERRVIRRWQTFVVRRRALNMAVMY